MMWCGTMFVERAASGSPTPRSRRRSRGHVSASPPVTSASSLADVRAALATYDETHGTLPEGEWWNAMAPDLFLAVLHYYPEIEAAVASEETHA
jgi:hypothetical protein